MFAVFPVLVFWSFRPLDLPPNAVATPHPYPCDSPGRVIRKNPGRFLTVFRKKLRQLHTARAGVILYFAGAAHYHDDLMPASASTSEPSNRSPETTRQPWLTKALLKHTVPKTLWLFCPATRSSGPPFP